MIYHTRGKHANQYTTDTVKLNNEVFTISTMKIYKLNLDLQSRKYMYIYISSLSATSGL